MPLQNRVTPMGNIVAEPERGMFTGNRGIIHDPLTRTLLKRRWASQAWLICSLQRRGVRRTVMGTRDTAFSIIMSSLPDDGDVQASPCSYFIDQVFRLTDLRMLGWPNGNANETELVQRSDPVG